MNYILLAVMAIVAGCSSDVDPIVDEQPTVDEPATCQSLPESSACTQPDGTMGQCRGGNCVLVCGTATDCPASTCRFAMCAAQVCQYFPVPNATPCMINADVGECQSAVCVVTH